MQTECPLLDPSSLLLVLPPAIPLIHRQPTDDDNTGADVTALLLAHKTHKTAAFLRWWDTAGTGCDHGYHGLLPAYKTDDAVMVEPRMRLDDVESCADAPGSPSRQVAELGKLGVRFHNISLRPGFKQPSGIHLCHPTEAKVQECRSCMRLDCDVHHHISLSSVSMAYVLGFNGNV